nr:hypothetical protein GCM10020063_027990 [Dactylosporangium thailandense]
MVVTGWPAVALSVVLALTAIVALIGAAVALRAGRRLIAAAEASYVALAGVTYAAIVRGVTWALLAAPVLIGATIGLRWLDRRRHRADVPGPS